MNVKEYLRSLKGHIKKLELRRADTRESIIIFEELPNSKMVLNLTVKEDIFTNNKGIIFIDVKEIK